MIVPPPLPSTSVSGVASSATLALAAGRAADPTLLISPESTRVSLSGVAQRILSQLASEPGLDIDTAFERSVFDLATDAANDGQLLSPTGRLEPFVPSPSLPVSSALPDGTVDTQTPLDTLLGATPSATPTDQPLVPAPVVPNDPNAAEAVDDGAIVVPAAVPTDAPVGTPAPAAATAANDAVAPASVTTDTGTPPAPPATNNPIDTQRAAGTLPRDADTNADTDLDPATIASLTLTDATEPDPFQQAALIAGLTSFGKEQNQFAAGTPDNDAVVRELAAVAPVRERRDQSTEEWLNARRDAR